MGAAACKMIEGLPCYSAGVNKVYALNCTSQRGLHFMSRHSMRSVALAEAFFAANGSRESFVALPTFVIPGKDEVTMEMMRNGFLCCPEKNVTDGFVRLVQDS